MEILANLMSNYLFIDEDGTVFFSDKFTKIDICCVDSGILQIIDIDTRKYMRVINNPWENDMNNQEIEWDDVRQGLTKVDSEGNEYTTYLE